MVLSLALDHVASICRVHLSRHQIILYIYILIAIMTSIHSFYLEL